MNDSGRVRFEDFEVDLRTEELFKLGNKLKLPHQSFCMLAMLLEKPGELVTRDEVCARLWPSSAHIEYDQRINATVNRLREALHDSADHPRYIETLPKRGYRFIASIDPASTPQITSARGLPHHGASPSESAPPLAAEHQGGSLSDPRQEEGVGRRYFSRLFVTAGALLAALAVTLMWLALRAPPHSRFGRHIVPLASLPGKEIAPTFSPDGSQVAFGWNEGKPEQFDIYVKSLSSEHLLKLTHQPGRWLSTAWSPDGSTLAFARESGKGAGLFVIPALGGSERSLVAGGLSIGFGQVSWSPDSRRLAYSAYGPKGPMTVYLILLQTGEVQPLSPAPACQNAHSPAFSPDGKQLALICTSSTGVYTVKVVGLEDQSIRTPASMFGEPQGLAWADDEHLILGNDPGDGGEMWQLALNGERQQLPFGEDGSAPTVAARGGRMAYVRAHRTVDIWRADLSIPRPEESAAKFIYSTRTQVNARYSKDAARIAFQSNRSGSVEIWMSNAEGGEVDRLTSFNGPLASSASWCSDGRRIAFDSRASGVAALYIEDINERVPRKLSTTQQNLSSPVWSPDCRWLFALDGNQVLYRIAAGGDAAQRFVEAPSSYYMTIADQLIFTALEPSGVQLCSKPVSGGAGRPLAGMPKVNWEDSWAATDAGVYYSESSPSEVSVNFYDFESKRVRRLMGLRQTPVPGGGPGLSVSPDGRWLLYGQSGDESSEIMLTEDR